MPDYSHNHIIACMKAYGCKADDEGICYGLSHMGMQAFNLGEKGIEELNARLRIIASHKPKELIEKIQ